MIKHDPRVLGDGFHYKDQFVFLQTLLRYGLLLKEKYIRFPFMVDHAHTHNLQEKQRNAEN